MILRSFCASSGMILKSFWVGSRKFWGVPAGSEVILGWFWSRSEVVLGWFWEVLWSF